VGNLHTAKNQMGSGPQAMQIETEPHAKLHREACSSCR
jgi:hypothetical protein